MPLNWGLFLYNSPSFWGFSKGEIIIATNEGKKFEQDFANSVNKDECWLYRLRDNAASFGGSTNTRFTSSNICDYVMYHNKTRTLYLLELKSTKSSSIPYSMIREVSSLVCGCSIDKTGDFYKRTSI